ncbi:MAG: nucleoside 2-deoxyribosyltransferase [Ignavibacterium album]|nr:nucleoside 2-deoxyribosyltransferase [Ignavibacterium album]
MKSYLEIIQYVENLGITALSEMNSKFTSSIPLTDRQIYTRDVKWIDGSDAMVAEVSGASLGVGFEIAYALFVKKIPVLALYNESVQKISSMISGCTNPKLKVKSYKDDDSLRKEVKAFLMEHKK